MNFQHIEKNLRKLVMQNGEELRFKTRKAAIAFLSLIVGTDCHIGKKYDDGTPIETEIFKTAYENGGITGLGVVDSLTRLELQFFHTKNGIYYNDTKFNLWIENYGTF